ncbi:MAG: DUF2157 domain-containing protein [Deltaproteobacteria bacterium]|nr:DUF2157 domain-containing protein [Deltaproteobacteria bacterium]
MAARWERYLERWTGAGLIENSTAELVRAYEAEQEKALGLRWQVLLAISLGGLLLGAGVLLFVAAHWDKLSPAERFGLVLALVALFHVLGALLVERFSVLSTALHAIGTICLGAGIFLAGQIFHLQEHWPGGVMLWALGAWVAWAVLRDWPQASLVAVLTPVWLSSEWLEATHGWMGRDKILAEGLLMLAISYLTAVLPEKETPGRKALAWIGGLALIPLTVIVVASGRVTFWELLPASYLMLGWMVALIAPLLLAWLLRRDAAWMNIIAALWVVTLGTTSTPGTEPGESLLRYLWHELGPYGICAVGSIGLIAWGLREARKERINLGVTGFALTVLFFYFSTVMDKLGRSASLIGLGLLFLLGGWLLEKTRRRLVARLEREA